MIRVGGAFCVPNTIRSAAQVMLRTLPLCPGHWRFGPGHSKLKDSLDLRRKGATGRTWPTGDVINDD